MIEHNNKKHMKAQILTKCLTAITTGTMFSITSRFTTYK